MTRFYFYALLISAASLSANVVFAQQDNGKQLYAEHCTRCHGPNGQGTSLYESPLTGELGIGELANLIQETMPEDEPGSLTANQSQTIAKYIHGQFYSPTANSVVRIELARLTVNQYRQTVADLLGHFRGQSHWGDQRGLTGHYLEGRNVWAGKQEKTKRVDPQVNFDFGKEVPIPEIEDPRQFSIRWHGSVIAPKTGNYTFVATTEHAVKVYVNDHEKPLVDGWVRSEGENEHRGDIYLIGGRAYPMRIEFSKATQGVDDSDKQKDKPPVKDAAISLSWKMPNDVVKLIPQRFLIPHGVPLSYVCSTAFPPDDRSYGWIRSTSISPEWDRANTLAALATAEYISDHLDQLASIPKDADNRRELLLKFCHRFAELAFRSPLSDDEKQLYVEKCFDESNDDQQAVQRSVLMVMKSPRFLFREIGCDDSFAIASRFAYGLTDSPPDNELLGAALREELSKEDIERHAQRIMDSPQALKKLNDFLLTWVGQDQEHAWSKDVERFPGFDEATASDLKASLELFLDDVLRSDHCDYRDLITSKDVYMNRRLGELFGKELTSDSLVKTAMDDRRGVVTHPYMLAVNSYRQESSPIHRGVFLARNVLGQRLMPPPEAFAPLSPDLHPKLTTRQRVTLQTADKDCMSCHLSINALGFTLENFDAVGRFRDSEREQPIDAATTLQFGETNREISGSQELAEWIAEQPAAHAAFCEQLFQFLVGQPIEAYPAGTREHLEWFFAQNNFHIRKLAVEIMVVSVSHGHDTGNR